MDYLNSTRYKQRDIELHVFLNGNAQVGAEVLERLDELDVWVHFREVNETIQ